MKNIKTICLLSLFLSISLSVQTEVTQKVSESTQGEVTQKLNKQKEIEIERKLNLIPESHKNLINIIFTEVPLYTLKTQSAYKKAQQILKELDPQTKNDIDKFNKKYNTQEKINALVVKYRDEIVRPVKDVFPLLHLKEYRFINEPLFINILIEEKTQNEIKLKTKKNNVSLEDIYAHINEKDIPLGLKFLKVDEKAAQTFFKDFIIDKETLITCCKEFDTLFGPFNKILTQKTKNNAVKYYKKLMSKKKK